MKLSKEVRRNAYIGRVKWATDMFNNIKPEGKVTGVEVGFWKGDFGYKMLEENERLYWIGVDPYFEYGRKARKQPIWDGIFERVMKKMERFGERFRIIRKPSSEGIKFITEKVDFVFIDGNHDFDFVYDDIFLYEEIIRKDGIMSGHDYINHVGPVVDKYVKEFGREMFLDASFDPCGVFWWRMK